MGGIASISHPLMKLIALALRIIIAAALFAACEQTPSHPEPSNAHPGDGYFWNNRTGQYELPGDKSGN